MLLNSNPSTASPVKPGLHLKRPCLLVSNLDRSLELYQTILGFRLDYRSAASPESYLYSVFQLPQEAQLTFATLSTNHESRAIALVEVKGISLPRPTPPHQTGIVIQVDELRSTIEQIIALNLTVVQPCQFKAPPNLLFTEQGFWDFDDHLIILYQMQELVLS